MARVSDLVRRLRRRSAERRFIPFVGHQVADYIFGASLVVVGAHSSGGMTYALLSSGAALCLLNVFSHGPLGLVKRLGRRAHAVVEGIILVGLALSPLAVFHGLNWVAVLLGEGIALVLVRLDLWSVYDRARHAAVTAPAGAVRLPVGVVAAHRRLPRAAPAEPGASPSAPAVPGASSAPRQRSDLHRLAARGAGRGVGIARRGARSAGSTVKPAVDSGARRLGKVIGGVSKRRDPGCPPDTSGG